MKVKRQSKILEIIKDNEIDTQEALAERLNSEGFNLQRFQLAMASRSMPLFLITKIR